jgi:hypothetical protein
MPLLNEALLNQYAASYKQSNAQLAAKSYEQIIEETRQSIPLGTPFDIFLSHSFADAQLILGLALVFQRLGYTVYIDWVVDADLDRSNVTKETADLLRKRMDDSKCLLYACTENTPESKWMPWETGYFDARAEKVAIIPILSGSKVGYEYKGQEYLGLYPYMKVAQNGQLYIIEEGDTWVAFDTWLKREKPKEQEPR